MRLTMKEKKKLGVEKRTKYGDNHHIFQEKVQSLQAYIRQNSRNNMEEIIWGLSPLFPSPLFPRASSSKELQHPFGIDFFMRQRFIISGRFLCEATGIIFS